MTANDRVRELRKHLNLTQVDFAARFRISQGHLTSVETGSRAVTARFARMLNLECGVREEWILSGEGAMFDDVGSDFVSEMSAKYQLSDFQQTLVRAVYEMPPELQRMAVEVARTIAFESYRNAEIDETEHERIERITNQYLDAHDAQDPLRQTDKKA